MRIVSVHSKLCWSPGECVCVVKSSPQLDGLVLTDVSELRKYIVFMLYNKPVLLYQWLYNIYCIPGPKFTKYGSKTWPQL